MSKRIFILIVLTAQAALAQGSVDKDMLTAVLNNDLPEVKRLYALGRSLDGMDEYGLPLFFYAAGYENPSVAKFLLDNNAPIIGTNKRFRSPFYYAATMEFYLTTKYAKEKGIKLTENDFPHPIYYYLANNDEQNIDKLFRNKDFSLYAATDRNSMKIFNAACFWCTPEIVTKVEDFIRENNERTDDSIKDPSCVKYEKCILTGVFYAALSGNVDVLKRMLSEKPVRVHYHGGRYSTRATPNNTQHSSRFYLSNMSFNNSVLHYAARSGNLEAIQLVIDYIPIEYPDLDEFNTQLQLHGINAKNWYGRSTPIMEAAKYNNYSAVLLLVCNGAEIWNIAKDYSENDKTLFDYLTFEQSVAAIRLYFLTQNRRCYNHSYDLFKAAAIHGDVRLAQLLFDLGCKYEVKEGKNSPLYYAILNNNLPMVKIFVDHGANPFAFEPECNQSSAPDPLITPFEKAYQLRRSEILDYLKPLRHKYPASFRPYKSRWSTFDNQSINIIEP